MENTPYYNPRVVIYERKIFIRLANGQSLLASAFFCEPKCFDLFDPCLNYREKSTSLLLGIKHVMELFSRRRWRLYRPQVVGLLCSWQTLKIMQGMHGIIYLQHESHLNAWKECFSFGKSEIVFVSSVCVMTSKGRRGSSVVNCFFH